MTMNVAQRCRTIGIAILPVLLTIACSDDAARAPDDTDSASLPKTAGPATGSLIVAGGNIRDPAIIKRFVDMAGGPVAPIVIVPTALEGDPATLDWDFQADFRDAGAKNLSVLHTRDAAEADTEAFIEPLKYARGVWFIGGRQWRIADAYLGTRTEVAFRAVLERGGVIGGSSAGATILGSYLARGDTQSNTVMMGDHEQGFGYIRNVAIDQHLLTRNRQFDLIEVIGAHPELLGIGIDEDTAIVVQGNQFEVVGQSYVAIYDNRRMVGSGGRFFFLMPGDRYDMATRQPLRPDDDSEPFAPLREQRWTDDGDDRH